MWEVGYGVGDAGACTPRPKIKIKRFIPHILEHQVDGGGVGRDHPLLSRVELSH